MNQESAFLAHDQLQALIKTLTEMNYRCIGPQVRDSAIIFDDLESVEQLPMGIAVEQSPGSYKLKKQKHTQYFAWANGPQAIKPMVFAPRESIWSCTRDENGSLKFEENIPSTKPIALLGVRPCDISALYVYDQHFLQQDYQDPYYLARRQQLLLITVNCTHPAQTCFCASTGDGPQARFGYDLALTELEDGFVINAHSQLGKTVLAQLPVQDIKPTQIQDASIALEQAKNAQTRQLKTTELYKPLFDNLEHTAWAKVGERCLGCGNCTSVCPTCFCHRETETADLDGTHSTHFREWDSCFSQEHSYIHGVMIRGDNAAHYRQWLTHKLGSWIEQYGRSGCVGCGRCITWCPVGIDITEEVANITGDG